MTSSVSVARTAWAIICPEHRQVFLSEPEYNRQMNLSSVRWTCPLCGDISIWDDDNYETFGVYEGQQGLIAWADMAKRQRDE